MPAYKLVELDERVGEDVEARTFFRGRAERIARHRNAQRLLPSYRYEVVREGRRWTVVPFQNQLQPVERIRRSERPKATKEWPYTPAKCEQDEAEVCGNPAYCREHGCQL